MTGRDIKPENGAHPDDHPGDIYVAPAYGEPHTHSRECWCSPRIDLQRDDGAAVVVHREAN